MGVADPAASCGAGAGLAVHGTSARDATVAGLAVRGTSTRDATIASFAALGIRGATVASRFARRTGGVDTAVGHSVDTAGSSP